MSGEGITGLAEKLAAMFGGGGPGKEKGSVTPAQTTEVPPASASAPAEQPQSLADLAQELGMNVDAAPELPQAPRSVATDATAGMGKFQEGLAQSFDDKAREYAERIIGGEDPATMGVPDGLRTKVGDLVKEISDAREKPKKTGFNTDAFLNAANAQQAEAASAPTETPQSPAAAESAPLPVEPTLTSVPAADATSTPDWLIPEPVTAAPLVPDATPDWMKPEPMAMPDATAASLPMPGGQTIEAVAPISGVADLEAAATAVSASGEIAGLDLKLAPEPATPPMPESFVPAPAASAEEISAPTAAAAAEVTLAPVEARPEAPATPVETGPALAIGFSGRVELARDAVGRAVAGYNGLRERIVKEQQQSGEYKGYGADLIEAEEERTGITEPEATDKELRAMESAAEQVKTAFGLEELPAELKNRLATQHQLKLGRSMARDAQTNWDAQLKKDLGAVTPQLWEKTSRLQREVDEIRTFFLRLGNSGSLQNEILEIEQGKAGPFWNILDKKQKQGIEAALMEKQDAFAAFGSLDGLLARGDMPVELRQVIEAARNGKPYNFGEGMVGGFRREAYGGILSALGLTLTEAAATQAATSAPVQEVPLPAEAAAQETIPAPELPAEPVTPAPTENPISEAVQRAQEFEQRFDAVSAGLPPKERLSPDALGRNVDGFGKIVAADTPVERVAGNISSRNPDRARQVAIAQTADRVARNIQQDKTLTDEERVRRLSRVGAIAHQLEASGIVAEGLMGILDAAVQAIVSEVSAQTGAKG